MFCSFAALVLDQFCDPMVGALVVVVLPHLRRLSYSVERLGVYLGVVVCCSLPD